MFSSTFAALSRGLSVSISFLFLVLFASSVLPSAAQGGTPQFRSLGSSCKQWETKYIALWNSSLSKCRRGAGGVVCCNLYASLNTALQFFTAPKPTGLGCKIVNTGTENVFQKLYIQNCASTAPSVNGGGDNGGTKGSGGGAGSKKPSPSASPVPSPSPSRVATAAPIPTRASPAPPTATATPNGGTRGGAGAGSGGGKGNGGSRNGDDNGGSGPTRPPDTPRPRPTEAPTPGGGGGGGGGGGRGTPTPVVTPPGGGGTGTNVKPIITQAPAICFHGSTKVSVKGRGEVRMEDVQIGDEVLVTEDGEYSRVFMFTHKMANVGARYVNIVAQGVDVLVTPLHYVHVVEGSHRKIVTAGEIKVGDNVLTIGGVRRVERVDAVDDKGLYNPQTLHGDIVAGGLVATTYTKAIEPGLAHALLTFPRMVYRAIGLSAHWWHCGWDVVGCKA